MLLSNRSIDMEGSGPFLLQENFPLTIDQGSLLKRTTHSHIKQSVVEQFTTIGPGTWQCPIGVTSIEYLIVAGGGNSAQIKSGYNSSAGGAGGEVKTGILTVIPGTVYNLSVGNNGQISSFDDLICQPGADGIAFDGGNTVGFNGGGGINTGSGGGAGANGNGSNGSGNNGGNGGTGVYSNITGTMLCYGSGGGGGGSLNGAPGGPRAGHGSGWATGAAYGPVANSGCGAGGRDYWHSNTINGASGIVIIKYWV